jgi:hypothetical protein
VYIAVSFQPPVASEQGIVVSVGTGGNEPVAIQAGTSVGAAPVGRAMVEEPKIMVPFPQSEKMVWYWVFVPTVTVVM